MTIVDDEISALVHQQPPLITNFLQESLSNCRYNLRAARAFRPQTGDELILQPPATRWSVKPSETLVIMTRESVNMPKNLYASYCQLNSLAQKGLMLINVSIVEPGYHGHLSCFVVNFSRQVVHLYPDAEVAKICFHRLSHAPTALKAHVIEENAYERSLSSAAELYPVSFMDIGGLEERISERVTGLEERVSQRVTQGVNSSIKIAVVFIAVLVLWTTLEPLTSKFLWEKLGVLSSSQRAEITQLRSDLGKTKDDLARSANDLQSQKMIGQLEKQLADQAQAIAELKKLVLHR
jgi:deoxycytidine triphosphate deaminase